MVMDEFQQYTKNVESHYEATIPSAQEQPYDTI